MKTKFIPVILSGGAGTRLWPLSRQQYPKQFIPLFENKNLFTQTLERIMPLQPEHVIVVCNKMHRFMVMEHLRDAGIENSTIIAESKSRNTAPAIALAAFWIQRHFEDKPMLVLPSDHYMKGENFSCCINDELLNAAVDHFITFGIKPTRAESGYGYVQVKSDAQSERQLLNVCKFTEKPNWTAAEEYIKTNLYYWNSGIFVFTASRYLSALKEYQNNIYDACDQAINNGEAGLIEGHNIVNPDSIFFEQSPNISVDYAIMERINNIQLCPLNIHWSDLGSWQALSEVQNTDDNGNALSGAGNIVVQDSNNNIIYAANKLVACLGISDCLIAETKDAVLIAHRSRGQEIKQLVSELREAGYTESDLHAKVYRPWGSYESIDKGENFQVKRIIVKPGQRLSLQSHKHRAEHWVVVAGKAKVTLDDEVLDLEVNQSVHIPIGARHRLENEGREALHLIEVQCGDYLEEDDIVRYEDNYGRVNE